MKTLIFVSLIFIAEQSLGANKVCINALSGEADSNAGAGGDSDARLQTTRLDAAQIEAAIKELAQAKIDLEDARITGALPKINLMAFEQEIARKENELRRNMGNEIFNKFYQSGFNTKIDTTDISNTNKSKDLSARKVSETNAFAHYATTLTLTRDNESRFTHAEFSPDGSQIIAIIDDEYAEIYNSVTGIRNLTIKARADEITSAKFSPDGKRIVIVCENGPTKIIDAVSGKRILSLKNSSGITNSAQFSPDGKSIVITTANNTAIIYDAISGIRRLTIKGDLGRFTSAQFSPDGTRILTNSSDYISAIFDSSTGVEISNLDSPYDTNEGNSISQYSPDGNQILKLDGHKKISTLDSISGKEILNFDSITGYFYTSQFSGDGRLIIAADNAEIAIKILDANSVKLLFKLNGHTENINSAQLNYNGTRVVSTSDDQTLRIWDKILIFDEVTP
jgi:WD40 repeat protein